MSDNPHISFSEVTLSFGAEKVLSNFSFHANPGEHTVLHGESGSGKSTILQLLLGFLEPVSGQVLINGSEMNPQEIRRQTAWLPQDLNLGSGSTREVIEKPFEFTANKSLDQNRQLNVLRELGLSSGVLDKQYRDLSTGQRQRVGLSICYLLDKPLLLLDEPTSALDIASKKKAANILIGHTNKTIISTSHDPFWVDHADKVIKIP